MDLLKCIVLFLAITGHVSLATGQSDFSMRFDGEDDRIIVGDSSAFKIDGQATIEFWLNVEELGSDLMLLVSKEGEYNIGLSKEGNISWAFANTIPGWNWVYSSSPLPIQTWVHVAVRYDLDFIDIFLNGTQITNTFSSGQVGDVDTVHNNLIIADREQDAFNLPFKGKMDEFRLWNIARSDAQIQATWMSKLQGDEPGLVVYYRFDDPDRPCDVVNSTADEFHGTRAGEGGQNNLPQWDDDTPDLLDVPQVASNPCLISSIGPEISSLECQISPNPASTHVQVTLDPSASERLEGQRFLLYNSIGQLVQVWPIAGVVTDIPVDQLGHGMYTLRVSAPFEVTAGRVVILR